MKIELHKRFWVIVKKVTFFAPFVDQDDQNQNFRVSKMALGIIKS